MASLSFKTDSYFPSGFAFAAGIIGAFGLLFTFVELMVGLPITLIGVVVATTHYRLIIDTEKKTYKESVWFLGYNTGELIPFEKIEYLFIKTSNESQTMYGRAARTTIHKRVFDGYLKFSETQKVHIATRDSKDELIVQLRHVAKALAVPINDHTQTA
jgi:hypothetical protein